MEMRWKTTAVDSATWKSWVTLLSSDEAVAFSVHFYVVTDSAEETLVTQQKRGQFMERGLCWCRGYRIQSPHGSQFEKRAGTRNEKRRENKLFARSSCVLKSRSLRICLSACDRVGRSLSTMELIPADLNMSWNMMDREEAHAIVWS